MRSVEQTSIGQAAASSREPREGRPRGEREFIFNILKQIADAIVATFPRAFEVVVHDISRPQKSIKHIVGDVTRRKVGGPATDLLVKALHREKGNIRDRHNYKTTTKDGRALKSTTVFIHNRAGAVVAALCINFDMTDFLNAVQALEIFTTTTNAFNGEGKAEIFAMSISETISAIFQQSVAKIGKQSTYMSTGEKIQLVRELKENGVFQIKGGVDQVAHLLGITRFTVYNYLKKIETEQRLIGL
jgi:predicted transcriptional regulator YheO